MYFTSGVFARPEEHHSGYLRIFRGRGIIEVWIGHRWFIIIRKD